ncbi:beta-galactosidase-1-like protein 2 [Anableps anableps]
MVSTMREILRRGMSVNLYMFHGGSSFGFMTGAVSDPSYRALVSSYDYDAPLSEAGEYTAKYHLLRDLFSRYNTRGDILPDMLTLRYREAYEPAIMYQHLSLWDALSFAEGPFKSSKPINMENLPANNANGQSYGYTLYETTITRGGLLLSGDNVRDHALHQDLELAVLDGKEKRTLSFLVENCGRVHRGRDLDKQHKGLVGDILLNHIPLQDFTIYSLDMKPSFIDSLYQAPWKSFPENPNFPGFFMGRLFAYGYPSDTFVKLPGWEKGVVFINGQNLGRYWSIGPQQALYLPAPFLNSGINQELFGWFEPRQIPGKLLFLKPQVYA